MDHSTWTSFFISAGIPASLADDYAVTFSKHRMRLDMLKDITKDILVDMNIKAMGDIIAILRHAKDLSQQDELKSHSVSRPIPSNNNKVAAQASEPSRQVSNLSAPTPNRQHLSQRTPITTSPKPGSNISSIVGNKIQSRLSLNSGLLLSSNNGSNHKRTSSSNVSDSLSKRLRPQEPSRPVARDLPEKTLTVYYPSSSAIARAQQRISGSTSLSASTDNSSIRSRLGTTMNAKGKLGSEQLYTGNNNHNTRDRNRPSHSTQSRARSRSREGQPRRASGDDGRQINRPKSTVFSRLGDTSRRAHT